MFEDLGLVAPVDMDEVVRIIVLCQRLYGVSVDDLDCGRRERLLKILDTGRRVFMVSEVEEGVNSCRIHEQHEQETVAGIHADFTDLRSSYSELLDVSYLSHVAIYYIVVCVNITDHVSLDKLSYGV